MGVKKYFIAIVIPGPAYGEVEAIKRQLFEGHDLKGGLRSPAHITLHMPFEWKEEKEPLLLERLAGFQFPESFDLTLDGFGFFEPRVIYVHVNPSEQLQLLYEKLKLFARRELRVFNEGENLRGFHPHVTVANRDLKKPLFYQLREVFKTKAFNATFRVTSVSLLRLEKSWEEIQRFELKMPL